MMKIVSFLLFSILLVSCGDTNSNPNKAISNSLPLESEQGEEKKLTDSKPIKNSKNLLKQYDSKKQSIIKNDTTFIVRNITEDYYHTIYIDETKKNNKRISREQSKVSKSLKQKINERVSSYKSTEKLVDFNLPLYWAPLYQYQNEFYLYNPCDGIYEYEYLITKTAVTNQFYDGPSISVISSSKRINDQHYYFEFHGKNGLQKLDVYIVDPKKEMAVFKFKDVEETYYQLFAATSSRGFYDVIVNNCRTQKEQEFKFEDIDYESLIKDIK